MIFVQGCFWHNHQGCIHGRIPNSNREFWEGKIARTKERDRRSSSALKAAGWHVVAVWECELADEQALLGRLVPELKSSFYQNHT